MEWRSRPIDGEADFLSLALQSELASSLLIGYIDRYRLEVPQNINAEETDLDWLTASLSWCDKLKHACATSHFIILSGPTGSGKTFSVKRIAQTNDWNYQECDQMVDLPRLFSIASRDSRRTMLIHIPNLADMNDKLLQYLLSVLRQIGSKRGKIPIIVVEVNEADRFTMSHSIRGKKTSVYKLCQCHSAMVAVQAFLPLIFNSHLFWNAKDKFCQAIVRAIPDFSLNAFAMSGVQTWWQWQMWRESQHHQTAKKDAEWVQHDIFRAAKNLIVPISKRSEIEDPLLETIATSLSEREIIDLGLFWCSESIGQRNVITGTRLLGAYNKSQNSASRDPEENELREFISLSHLNGATTRSTFHRDPLHPIVPTNPFLTEVACNLLTFASSLDPFPSSYLREQLLLQNLWSGVKYSSHFKSTFSFANLGAWLKERQRQRKDESRIESKDWVIVTD